MKWKGYQMAAVLCCGLYALTGPAEAEPQKQLSGMSQVQTVFPEEHPTDCVLARSRRLFKMYRGQGALLLRNHGAAQAQIFVNGRVVPLGKALDEGQSETWIDISPYTRDGDNTLKVLDILPAGSHLEVCVPYPTLREGTPEEAGFSAAGLERVDEQIEQDVQKGLPGAVLLVLKNGIIVRERAYGWAACYAGQTRLPESQCEAMQPDTIFDLASNTKMYATLLACMKLTGEGKLDPEARVAQYLPGFTGGGREKIRVRDLMTHSAGFQPVVRFYRWQTGEPYSRERKRTMHLLEKLPLQYPTGSKTLYSDVDYMLLGAVVEKITGERLDTYAEKQIYAPLGLRHTCFNPLQKGILPQQIAATEVCGNTRSGMVDFPGVRTYTLRGEVQDESAWYSMGGVSGHAGLFACAGDLAVLAQLLLNHGGYGSYQLCDAQVMTYYTKPTDRNPLYGLGWNKAGAPERVWEFGPYADNQAFAHTGWTGTDIVLDPRHDLAVILLTNRLHTANVSGKPDDFLADNLETTNYGSIMSLVYEAFLEKQ